MSFKFKLLLEVKQGIKAAANKPVFSFDAEGNSIRRRCLSSARHTSPAPTSFPRRHMYQCGFCLASEQGRAYPYYTAVSGFLAEACKYQKGIICCECRNTPGRHTHTHTHRSATLENRTSLHIATHGSSQMITDLMGQYSTHHRLRARH